MQDLKKLVLDKNLDMGLGFDGDGDRLGVVDDKGNILFGDVLMILFWREILSKRDPRTVKASWKLSAPKHWWENSREWVQKWSCTELAIVS